MKYKIAICDDMDQDVQYIASVVDEWALKENITVNIEKFPSAESFLFYYAEHKDFDILLLDMERIKDCVEKAGLSAKINSLKDGYQTYLNRIIYEDGAELSGGETQKLMLARALYKKAPFIILDEPTSALDPIAEADMYNKYNELTKDCTSVYISHRLASTRFCDRILLIDDHRIAEEGTHEELLKLSGKYAQLFEIQSKYYREGDINETGQEAADMA